MTIATVRVVTISVDELQVLIEQSIERALVSAKQKQIAGVQLLSASRAARVARCRASLVAAACASGALPAQWSGRRWSIRAADLDAWATSIRR
jgi:hypothetical protein